MLAVGNKWAHKYVLVECDNMAVMFVIYSAKIQLCCICYGVCIIKLRAKHLQGVLNVQADAISRNNFQVFREAMPGPAPLPVHIPLAADRSADGDLCCTTVGQAARSYNSVLSVLSEHRFPAATENVLILFVTHLDQKCCHSTIRSYLSAVRFLHIVYSQGDPLQKESVA